MKQFRAIVSCKEDPCKYCRRPAASFPLIEKPTRLEAEAHASAALKNIYGGSAHKIEIEWREVGEWESVGDD